jgi:hypothetical protein
MKKRMLYLVVTGFLGLVSLVTFAQIQKTYTGDWKFEAPDSPEGSTFGIVTLKKDSAIMTFDGYEKFSSSWVKVKKDSIIYEVDFGDTKVVFSLKVNDDDNTMSGKAVWDEGETPILLSKTEPKAIGVRI